MRIEKDKVLHIARLARLALTDPEIERLETQMGDMIAFADQLGELDLSATAPTTHAVPMENVFREDTHTPSLERDEILKNAPRQDGLCVVVPRVVE